MVVRSRTGLLSGLVYKRTRGGIYGSLLSDMACSATTVTLRPVLSRMSVACQPSSSAQESSRPLVSAHNTSGLSMWTTHPGTFPLTGVD